MPYVETAGARIYYERLGAGRRLLFVHGGTGTGAYDWEHQRPLAERFELVIPDLRSHGRSTDPNFDLTLDTIASDMLELASALDGPIDAVVGFSVGATAMLRRYTRAPTLGHAFVAIGASYRGGTPERVAEITSGPWPEELRNLRHEAAADPEHWRKLRQQLARTWAEDLHLEAQDLARVACPTMAVCGDRDPIEPLETAAAIARAIPLSELLVVPRAGHLAQRERPAVVNAGIVEFLERVL